ncbi:flagellar hook-length control protein FliK [Aquabacterium sp. NJ1]|uniref:flagellar hook-length control protein FliK n=1 Tax=Aquabacterium sp. NJ1 TaxID=1538295 RepID=UPI0009DCCE71|nr:flagellar hook-length control protein FliK [Aquabacterium sp. NJ1]
MATPIKSTTNSGMNPGVNGVSPAISDLLARFGTQGGDGQSQQMAFAQWMDKHTVTASDAPKKAHTEPAKAPSAQPNANARAAEQALARQRQQAMLANKSVENKPAEQTAQQADDDADKVDSRPASTTRKDAAGNKAAKAGDKVDKKDDADKDDQDEVKFSTATGDGAAVVRELTPPATIQAGDAAGMMAWLASLTHGDLAHGKAVAGDVQGDASGTSTAQLQGTDGHAQDAALLDPKAAGAQGAIALDNPLWQSASSTASLQVDALLGQSGRAQESKVDVDPLAGLVAGGGIKGAGFGTSEAGNVARHESATLSTPLDSPDFAQALADKVSMWVGSAKDDGSMTAELHLNPADMGPINVKISLDGQTAQVDFAAAALETRKAIEASLPMLSSALSDVGLNMTGGDVSSQTSQQQFDQNFAQAQGGNGRGTGASGRDDADTGVEPASMRAVAAPRPGRLGGLDLYA